MESGVRGDFAALTRLRTGVERLADNGFARLVRVVERAADRELRAGFAGSHDASGAAWPETTDGRPALVTYGKHWTTRSAGNVVSLSSNHIGARAHQLGATIRPLTADGVLAFTIGGRKIVARKVVLPARRVTPRNGSLETWARPINAAVARALPLLAGVQS